MCGLGFRQMPTAFSLPRKSLSLNAKLSDNYAASIAQAAQEKHSGGKFGHLLYSRILWFQKRPSRHGDVDNIAKKIHDSFETGSFEDDSLITQPDCWSGSFGGCRSASRSPPVWSLNRLFHCCFCPVHHQITTQNIYHKSCIFQICGFGEQSY